MEKKEQVYQHIRTDTITKLKEEQFESLGLDTLTVSLDLKMNRANISRLLNQLYNEGRLIKTDSRPVFFMDRSAHHPKGQDNQGLSGYRQCICIQGTAGSYQHL